MPEPTYPWPEGRQSAFCFSVDVDAHAPWLWANRDRPTPYLGQLELRRFGPRTGLWRLADLLARFEIKGSFFVPGVVAEHYPEILPRLAEMGHELGLHGYYHELAGDISDAEFTAALDRSFDLFRAQIGRPPSGFRSPAWEMTEHMLAELRRRGLYDSSLMGQDHPYTLDGVCEIPVQWTLDDAVYFKFLGGGADRWAPVPPGPVLEGWLDEWRVLHRFGGLCMVTVHDWISGRAQRIALLERMLEKIRAEPGVWIATAGQLAAHHRGTAATKRLSFAAQPPEMPPAAPGGAPRAPADRGA